VLFFDKSREHSRVDFQLVRPRPLARKGHRYDTYFYGDDSGDWSVSGAVLGFRREWDWEMAPSLSSKNDWRNFSVDGATENNIGFRKALKAIVADYPEVANFWLSFDGPYKPVREVLGLSDSWDDLVFLHWNLDGLLACH